MKKRLELKIRIGEDNSFVSYLCEKVWRKPNEKSSVSVSVEDGVLEITFVGDSEEEIDFSRIPVEKIISVRIFTPEVETEEAEPELESEEIEAVETEPEETEAVETEPEETESEGTEAEETESEGTESEGTESEGTESEVTESEGTESEVTESEVTESEGTESEGTESEGTESEGTESEETESEGTESEGTESEGTESEGTESEGTEAEGTEAEGTEAEVTESEEPEPVRPVFTRGTKGRKSLDKQGIELIKDFEKNSRSYKEFILKIRDFLKVSKYYNNFFMNMIEVTSDRLSWKKIQEKMGDSYSESAKISVSKMVKEAFRPLGSSMTLLALLEVISKYKDFDFCNSGRIAKLVAVMEKRNNSLYLNYSEQVKESLKKISGNDPVREIRTDLAKRIPEPDQHRVLAIVFEAFKECFGDDFKNQDFNSLS